jgi:GT2 family glycosyltransferase
VAGLDDLTALVLDWNLPEYTIRSVEALVADGVPPARIVVIENGPAEEDWQLVARSLPACVRVRVERNVGFARANNIGARVLPGSAYLLVNNDAFVNRPGSVSRLREAVARSGVGIAVPRLVYENLSLQPSVAPFTTPSVALVRASGLSRFVPNKWQPKWSTHWDHRSSREIEAAIAAVMMVSAEAWDAVGGLHESSFMYAEDIDICWRARELGFAAWFEADAEFIHVGSASSTAWTGGEREERVGRAEAAMIHRHLSPRRAATSLAFMRAGVAGRALAFGLIGRGAAAAANRGFFRGYGAPSAELAAPPEAEPHIEVLAPGA